MKFEKENGSQHSEKVSDGVALFHEWGVEHVEDENGYGNFTCAVVEREDGTIEMPRAEMIRFIKPMATK